MVSYEETTVDFVKGHEGLYNKTEKSSRRSAGRIVCSKNMQAAEAKGLPMEN